MIGQQAPIVAHQKPRTENVQLQVRPVARNVQLHHALVIQKRLAERVHRDPNRISTAAIKKLHHHVQQAHTRPVGLHDCLREFAFALQAIQPALRVQQLFP